MGKNGYPIMHEIKNIPITPEILKLIAEIDEFKGRWKAMQALAPERPPPDGAPIQGLNFSVGSVERILRQAAFEGNPGSL
jgi:hypothetical protein